MYILYLKQGLKEFGQNLIGLRVIGGVHYLNKTISCCDEQNFMHFLSKKRHQGQCLYRIKLKKSSKAKKTRQCKGS